MKKWMLGFVLLAMVLGESSCVVRERRVHRRPPPPRHGVVVY